GQAGRAPRRGLPFRPAGLPGGVVARRRPRAYPGAGGAARAGRRRRRRDAAGGGAAGRVARPRPARRGGRQRAAHRRPPPGAGARRRRRVRAGGQGRAGRAGAGRGGAGSAGSPGEVQAPHPAGTGAGGGRDRLLPRKGRRPGAVGRRDPGRARRFGGAGGDGLAGAAPRRGPDAAAPGVGEARPLRRRRRQGRRRGRRGLRGRGLRARPGGGVDGGHVGRFGHRRPGARNRLRGRRQRGAGGARGPAPRPAAALGVVGRRGRGGARRGAGRAAPAGLLPAQARLRAGAPPVAPGGAGSCRDRPFGRGAPDQDHRPAGRHGRARSGHAPGSAGGVAAL
ncbi:MAG: DNA polymerase III delta subunit, partial [uncultured Acetobacteraceae bacterium]